MVNTGTSWSKGCSFHNPPLFDPANINPSLHPTFNVPPNRIHSFTFTAKMLYFKFLPVVAGENRPLAET
jgi:hypothetical protein